MTFPLPVLEGDEITAQGVVTAVYGDGAERFADCDIWLARGQGDRPLRGRATVKLAD